MRVAPGLSCVLPLLGSCLEPTEVKLQLSTDIDDVAPVTILVDGRQVTTMEHLRSTEGKRSLVIVPSKKSEAKFTIQIEGTAANQKVRASRSVSYINHQTLVLPIELQASCLGVSCDPGSTCFKGRCVDEHVVCAVTKQCEPSDDGGLPPMMDSGTDAAPTCPEGPLGGIMFNAPLHHWHFDETTGPFKDIAGTADIPRIAGFDAVPNMATPSCGQQLQLGGTKLPLGTAMTNGGLGVVFDLYNPNNLAVPLIVANDAAFPRWYVDTFSSNGRWSISVGIEQGGLSGGAPGNIFITPDNKFHRVELSGQNSTIFLAIDGQVVMLASSCPIPAGKFPLVIYGGGNGVAMDNLHVYAVP